METVTSRDGTHIAYWKDGQGPPLLLVHGGLSDRTAWVLVQPLLSDRFTVYTVNRRGREGSGLPRKHRYADEFDDLVAVVEAIGEPVHLLGHSGGALCAMGASLLTDRLRSLILYEPPRPGPHFRDLAKVLEDLIAEGKAEEAALTFYRMGPATPESDIQRLKASPLWPRIVELAATLPLELEAAATYEVEAAQFSTLSIPLLILLGGESPPQLREVGEELARVVPNARLVELPGQQHGANLAAPELFASEVVKFLEGAKA